MISEKSEPVIFLLEGVYGLYVLIPITLSPFNICDLLSQLVLCLTILSKLLSVLQTLRRSRYLCCPLSAER